MVPDNFFCCHFCNDTAVFVGAQSEDQGKTVEWFPLCRDHADGWNEGGDWEAPVVTVSDYLELCDAMRDVERMIQEALS